MQQVIEALSAASPVALVALAVFLVAAIVVGRVASNTFHGKYPPVLEGIPFIGGLRKFVQVRGVAGRQPRPASAATAEQMALAAP